MNWFRTMRPPLFPKEGFGACYKFDNVLSCWASTQLLMLLAITVVGCNSVRVVRSNAERTVQNNGTLQPPAWPHRYAVTASASSDDGPRLQEIGDELQEEGEGQLQGQGGGEGDGEDLEIIQAAAQQRPVTNYAAQPASGPAGSGMITGRVVDSSGRPQPFVSIVASPTRRPGGARGEAMTDQRGAFALRGLDPGQRYLILATATRSPVPLIGRVAVVASQQGITIGISQPHTTVPQAGPQMGRRDLDRPITPAPARPTDNSDRASFQSANPFSRTPDSKATAPAGPARPAPKQTREQVIANNRLESPWDMPAPPRRTAQPATKSATPTPTPPRTDDRARSPGGWQKAGTTANNARQAAPAAGFSLLDSAPTDSQTGSDRRTAIEPDDSLESARPQSKAGNPPATRSPFDAEADANPDRSKALVTKAKIPIEPVPEHGARPGNRTVQLHDRPMCQMDGNRLVDFQLNDADGRPVSFASIDSQLVLIDFWTTYCTPCLRAMPHLAALQKRYGSQGLQVVGIACEQGNMADRRARVARIRNQLQIPYPLLIDEGGDNLLVRDNFRVISYPTLVLLDKSGKVLWRSETAEPADLVRLENLLKSQLNPTAIRYN
jgi:thiol-disulfide isomerase/thioredoxin